MDPYNLKIPKSSPYSSGYIVNLPGDARLLKRDKIKYPFSSERDKRHLVIAGQTLSGISNKYYRNSLYWVILADVNNIYNPFVLTAGSILLIPDKDIIDSLL